MKEKFSFNIFNIVSVFIIILLIIAIVCPFKPADMKQAQRIAKWKAEYERLKYSFSLIDLHEGIIAETLDGKELISVEEIIERFKPYFKFSQDQLSYYKNYRYKRKNGRSIPKNGQFYFDKFIKNKNGSLISIKQNMSYNGIKEQPLFYMFVDVNGEEKPNRAGDDIFFINIFKHKIEALGYDKDYKHLRQNCSPIASGLYCSEFYLLGGHF